MLRLQVDLFLGRVDVRERHALLRASRPAQAVAEAGDDAGIALAIERARGGAGEA